MALLRATLFAGLLVTSNVYAADKLFPANVTDVRSNHLFPATQYTLTVEVPCNAKVAGTLQDIDLRASRATIGVLLKEMGAACTEAPEIQTYEFQVSAPVIQEIIILGAPK